MLGGGGGLVHEFPVGFEEAEIIVRERGFGEGEARRDNAGAGRVRERRDVCFEEGAGAFGLGGFGAGHAEAGFEREGDAFGEDGFANGDALGAHGGEEFFFLGADGHHAIWFGAGGLGAGAVVEDEAGGGGRVKRLGSRGGVSWSWGRAEVWHCGSERLGG